jgi:hypothetical protein
MVRQREQKWAKMQTKCKQNANKMRTKCATINPQNILFNTTLRTKCKKMQENATTLSTLGTQFAKGECVTPPFCKW